MKGSVKGDLDELFKSDIHPEVIKKKIKIHEYKGQYSIKIPKIVIRELGIKKGAPCMIEYDTVKKQCFIKLGVTNAKKKKTTSSNR